MNNKLPIEVKKDHFFTRLFRFLKSIFKKKEEIDGIKVNKKLDNNITFKENNLEKLKPESISKRNPKKVMEEIIKIVEKNPDTLERLDITKLEIIDAYYKRKINEYKRKLKRKRI